MGKYLDKDGVKILWKKVKANDEATKNAVLNDLTGGNGTTVKNAENVKKSIGGIDITEIFEPSGLVGSSLPKIRNVVKEATKATLDSEGNSITGTYQKILTFDSAPAKGSVNPVTSNGIYTAVDEVRNLAVGKTKALVIEFAGVSSDYSNSAFNIAKGQGKDEVRIHSTSISDVFKIKHADGTEYYVSRANLLGDSPQYLKVGDLIYTSPKNIKDWWYAGFVLDTLQSSGSSGKEGDFVFKVLDADSPDLTSYAKNTDTINKIELDAKNRALVVTYNKTGNNPATVKNVEGFGSGAFAHISSSTDLMKHDPSTNMITGVSEGLATCAQVVAHLSAYYVPLTENEINEAIAEAEKGN